MCWDKCECLQAWEWGRESMLFSGGVTFIKGRITKKKTNQWNLRIVYTIGFLFGLSGREDIFKNPRTWEFADLLQKIQDLKDLNFYWEKITAFERSSEVQRHHNVNSLICIHRFYWACETIITCCNRVDRGRDREKNRKRERKWGVCLHDGECLWIFVHLCVCHCVNDWVAVLSRH